MDFLTDIPVTKRPMNLRELSARFTGLAGGAAIGLAAPHVFCLGLILTGTVGLGTPATHATPISYLLGAGGVLGATIIGTYGLSRSQKSCCVAFGETAGERIKKSMLMVAPGLAVAAIANTALGRGLSDPALTAQSIQMAMMQGRDVLSILVDICTTGRVNALTP